MVGWYILILKICKISLLQCSISHVEASDSMKDQTRLAGSLLKGWNTPGLVASSSKLGGSGAVNGSLSDWTCFSCSSPKIAARSRADRTGCGWANLNLYLPDQRSTYNGWWNGLLQSVTLLVLRESGSRHSKFMKWREILGHFRQWKRLWGCGN